MRLVLGTADWTAVGFRLAAVDVLASDAEHEVVGHLGPDPLGPEWDAAEAVARLRALEDSEIGTALLDQRVMAGPGNIYKCEVCFLRGVHPATPVSEVPDLEGLVALTARLMQANRTTGRQITTGDMGRGKTQWVYGRAGEPCLRCGTKIARADQAGYGGDRVTFWCPACQPRGATEPSAPPSRR